MESYWSYSLLIESFIEYIDQCLKNKGTPLFHAPETIAENLQTQQ